MKTKRVYLLLLFLLLAPALACNAGLGTPQETAIPTGQDQSFAQSSTAAVLGDEAVTPDAAGEAPAGLDSPQPEVGPTAEPVEEEPAEELSEPMEEGLGEEPLVFEPPEAADSAAISGDESVEAEAENTADPGDSLESESRSSPEDPAAETAALLYTSDGNPCRRPIRRTTLPFGGTGLQPINLDPGGNGAAGQALLAQIPHAGLEQAGFSAPTGAQIVTLGDIDGDFEAELILWDTVTGQQLDQLAPGTDLSQLSLSRNQPLLAVLTPAGTAQLWDLDAPPSAIAVETGNRSRLALSPDGRYLAISRAAFDSEGSIPGSWGVIHLYEVASGLEIHRLEGQIVTDPESSSESGPQFSEMENGHASPIDGLTFTPNGQALLSLSVRDGTMRLWDIETGQHLRCFEFDLADVSNHASFSADGREIVTTGGESLLIWDTATSMVDRRFDPLGILDVNYDSAVFSQQGKRLITSTREQRAAYVWDGERGDLLALLRHTGFVEEAVDSPDGATILTIVTDPDNFNQREAWLWDAGHAALEQAAVAQSLVLAGLQAGWDGDVPGMVIALREAEAFSPDDGALLHPAVWDRACRFGSLAGQPEEVVDACQRAVELAEQQATGTLGAATVAPFRDSRGLALALLGAYPEAIADFQYYVDNPTFLEDEDVDRRLAWIAALRDNRNPFDEATLQALRTEME